jgi:hypothetical protein
MFFGIIGTDFKFPSIVQRNISTTLSSQTESYAQQFFNGILYYCVYVLATRRNDNQLYRVPSVDLCSLELHKFIS